MSLADGYLFHVVARLGNAADVPTLIMGEFGMDVDTQTMRLGNDTNVPLKILTTGSLDSFDFSKASQITLPGGILFDKSTPGKVNGVSLKNLNLANGFLVRRGDDQWGAVSFRSPDNSLLVTAGGGTQATVDLRINPDSDIIQQLFHGIGILNIGSITGLQDALDAISAAIVAARTGAVNDVRGNVPADYNTLEKIYNLVNTNVVVVGDPSGVVAQVLAIIRDGVDPSRNTLKKISDVIDTIQTNLTNLTTTVGSLGIGGTYYDGFWQAIAINHATTQKILLGIIDRHNRGHKAYG